jgi:hypothetical protein
MHPTGAHAARMPTRLIAKALASLRSREKGFPREDVSQLLVRCHRRCCVCHRFCGVKIETDHIVQPADGVLDDIANAIPVCFDCHADIHSYNDKHPRGRKFTPDELRQHKDQWLTNCEKHPDLLVSKSASSDGDVGPLQALIDELEFNLLVATSHVRGCPFREVQFDRAIAHGVLSLVDERLKNAVMTAYTYIGRTNMILTSLATRRGAGSTITGSASTDPRYDDCAEAIKVAIGDAHRALLDAFASEDNE